VVFDVPVDTHDVRAEVGQDRPSWF